MNVENTLNVLNSVGIPLKALVWQLFVFKILSVHFGRIGLI